MLRIRVGLWLGLVTVLMAFAFIAAPESRLWNARMLPFYYLLLCLLAAIGVAELSRAIALLASRDPERPLLSVNTGVTAFSLLVAVIVVGLPLRALPGETSDTDGFHWKPEVLGVSLPLPTISTGADANPAPDWARWNYSGYEGKPAYPEYYRLATTMQRVGQEHGCGRAMWEYDDPRLERYGTPMAPMLLSLFTDGCIGSMEGLYFESAATTPYHFLNAAELSKAPSNPQRDLPYGTLDVAKGVGHLQMMGARYYMAFSPEALTQAHNNPDLRLIARSKPWEIFEVRDSAEVAPLHDQPAVFRDPPSSARDWLDVAAAFYQGEPDTWTVPLAAAVGNRALCKGS